MSSVTLKAYFSPSTSTIELSLLEVLKVELHLSFLVHGDPVLKDLALQLHNCATISLSPRDLLGVRAFKGNLVKFVDPLSIRST
uniref:Uncharacterized protein n=1 Tax=Candidatus Aramenus sulfurataquae TaxID=1326980 RepID=A0A0F2LMD4_9CREN